MKFSSDLLYELCLPRRLSYLTKTRRTTAPVDVRIRAAIWQELKKTINFYLNIKYLKFNKTNIVEKLQLFTFEIMYLFYLIKFYKIIIEI